MTTQAPEFIRFLLDSEALRFGDFTTKSGRRTPFFVNTGTFQTGAQLALLGRFYARVVREQMGEVDVLFGPAYKGIPLAVATAAALAADGVDVAYSSLRKEEKDHGDKGAWLGREPRRGDRVVIIEDVTTAGTSVRESMPALEAAGATVVGLVIAVDRQERGAGDRSALAEVASTYGIRTAAITTIDEVVAALGDELDPELRARIAAYRAEYGA